MYEEEDKDEPAQAVADEGTRINKGSRTALSRVVFQRQSDTLREAPTSRFRPREDL
jgi:hypothetical protein